MNTRRWPSYAKQTNRYRFRDVRAPVGSSTNEIALRQLRDNDIIHRRVVEDQRKQIEALQAQVRRLEEAAKATVPATPEVNS